MANLVNLYEALVAMTHSSDVEELRDFSQHLDAIQEQDYGPGGEFARAVQEQVNMVIEAKEKGL